VVRHIPISTHTAVGLVMVRIMVSLVALKMLTNAIMVMVILLAAFMSSFYATLLAFRI